MSPFRSSFGGGNDDLFADADVFDTSYIPEPGEFLSGQRVLTGEDHLQFHRVTDELFEERGVYDMTFGYNLARLNLDTRHPGAGYRYAEERDDPSVLRAAFTPTTPFCPQSDTLAKGSLRAWNDLRDRHEYDLVRVRVAGMHHQSEGINDALADLDRTYREDDTGKRSVEHVESTGSDRRTLTDTDDSEEIDAVLGALSDPDAREILRATNGTPRSALEFADRCDLAVSTAYRKVDLLVTAGFLEERIDIDTNGHHTAVYELVVEDVDVSIAEGTVELVEQ